MDTLDALLGHLVGDRVIARPGETINAGADREAGTEFDRHTEQFVDVALAIADMDAIRVALPSSAVDRRMLSSQRTLSFSSIGMRVGSIFFLSAAVPSNLSRVQNSAAARPTGRPSSVTTRLACMSSPQAVWIRVPPALASPPFTPAAKPAAPPGPRV